VAAPGDLVMGLSNLDCGGAVVEHFLMPPVPTDLDSLLKLAEGLRELEVTIGPQARPVIAAVRQRLDEAAAYRAKGNVPAAFQAIREAMARLAALAGKLDPAEGMLMNTVAERFATALNLGDTGVAKEAVNFIRHRAGDPKDDPHSDW
jgi:hypothetical protein